jgi:hypothetical protein
MSLAHDDRRVARSAETSRYLFDPLRTGLADPAAAPAAVGTVQRAAVRFLGGTDDADVAAASAYLSRGVALRPDTGRPKLAPAPAAWPAA